MKKFVRYQVVFDSQLLFECVECLKAVRYWRDAGKKGVVVRVERWFDGLGKWWDETEILVD